MRTSLEEERRLLLEQIEASRAVYRRMLSGQGPDRNSTMSEAMMTRQRLHSPRRQIVQWMVDHPLHVAAGVTLLVWLGPRLIQRIRAQRQKKRALETSLPNRGGGTVKAIATVLILLLRDPRRLQSTTKLLTTAWRWLRRTTSISTSIHGRKPHA
jgi:hypothetical protein